MKTKNATIAEKAYNYHDYLVSYAKRYTNNLEDARDLVQEAYCSLIEYNCIPQMDIDDKRFCGYLRQVVYTRWMDSVRKNEATEEIPATLVAKEENVQEDRAFAEKVLEKVLTTIPTAVRETMSLFYKGFNVLMIRNHTGISEEMVRYTIRKYEPLMTRRLRNYAQYALV